jgi:crossover junction endodeoxyribonuclease RuvC
LLLGQARGALLSALVCNSMPISEYTALQMKQAVSGYGRADKAQIQEMVRRLLKLPGLPGPDAADALGLAITHSHAGGTLAKLASAQPDQVGQPLSDRGYRAGRSR